MADIFHDLLHSDCKHGLTKRTCSYCLAELQGGKSMKREYRNRIAEAFPEKKLEQPVHECERCKKFGANKGNRITVRLPRGRVSFSVGAPVYPPTFAGETWNKPRVRKATHRSRGVWLCDLCDPHHVPKDKAPAVFKATDVFA